MRRRVIMRIALMILGIELLGGCKQAGGTGEEEKFSVVENMRMQVKNEGIFYIDGYTELMKFYDFGLAQSIPICDKSNCEHNSAKCNAYLPQGYMSGMGCYRDKLYYYDNMSPGVPFYQCDKNGSNRKLLVKLDEKGEYENLSVSLPMFFVDDNLLFGLEYFNLLTEPVEKEDGTLVEQERFWMLGKINLDSGKFEIIKEADAIDSAEVISIQDYMDGKIFYSRLYGKNACEQYVYDIETKKDKLLFGTADEPVYYLGAVRDEDREIYGTASGKASNVYSVDAETGQEEIVTKKEAAEGDEIYLNMSGGNLFYCIYEEGKGTREGKEFGVYGLDSGEEKILTKEEYKYAPSIAETPEWCLGMTEDGVVCISKEAYEKKEWDKVQVIGSF